MSTDLVSAPPTHLIPPIEAVSRISQADIVNMMVVRHRETEEKRLQELGDQIEDQRAAIEREIGAVFVQARAQVEAEIGAKVRRLQAAGKGLGLPIKLSESRPAVRFWRDSGGIYLGLVEAAASVNDDDDARYSRIRPADMGQNLMSWEQAVLAWLGAGERQPPLSCVFTAAIEAHGRTLVHVPLRRFTQPAACATLRVRLDELRALNLLASQQRAALKDMEALRAKLHAALTEHTLRAGGVDLSGWLPPGL